MADSDSDSDDSVNYDNENEQGVGNYVYSKDVKSFEEQYKAAVKAIKTTTNDREIDVDGFLSAHGAVAGQSAGHGSENLLHAIVDMIKRDDMKSEHVRCLVQRLVEDYPQLLLHQSNDGYNPLHMAIRDSAYQLAEYMISACISSKNTDATRPYAKQNLEITLLQTAQGGRTTLHAAFLGNLNLSTAKLLIENASDDALEAQDDKDNTPMHYAASFKQCTDAGAEIIALLIARDLEALRRKKSSGATFLDLLNAEGRSVYEELQFSRQNEIRRQRARKKQRAPNQISDQSVSTARPASNIPPKYPKADSKPQISVQVSARDAALSLDYSIKEAKLDDRERERQQKKKEEAERLKAEAEALARKSRVDFVRGQGTTGRDASRHSQSQTNDIESQILTVPSTLDDGKKTIKSVESLANTSIKRRDTGRLDGKLEQGGLAAEALPVASKSNIQGDFNVKRKVSKEILLKLKLHYMRTRTSEMVLTFLYGANMNDVQISFDYDRLPAKVVWNEFEKQFGRDDKSGLRFDRVLQYVTFPQVEVTIKGRLTDRQVGASKSQQEHLGRKDMLHFFNWLYEKGVRHIIRVTVKDSGDPGEKIHTDQSIQQCLERFIVESLDWQKTDLDPETILRVSTRSLEKVAPTSEDPKNVELLPDRQLRELRLRWSGNNAVLRAWSEPEGLPMLPRLERVHLLTPPASKMFDDLQWIEQKVEDFRLRLNKNFRKARDKDLKLGQEDAFQPANEIEVLHAAIDTDGDSKLTARGVSDFTTSTSVKGLNSHKWLDSTSRFAGEMRSFWDNTLEQWNNIPNKILRPEEDFEGDVVVALIDDGVDRLDNTLSGQVLEGKSFDYHDGQVRPPFSSARGHGTVMASMILRVCPMAKIYPIRLKTYDVSGGKSQIDRKYAAKAIKAALAKNATIISMSWTLPKSSAENETKDELHEILDMAVKRKVIMFCSSPDEGKFTEFDYPSGPWRSRFFRIGAARADGTVFEWTPDDEISFVLPGVDVVKEQAGRTSSEAQSFGVTSRVADFKYETGSSVATALAAGLAAMIIYCVKVSIMALRIANPNMDSVIGIAVTSDDLKRISQHDAMKQAFSTLGNVTPNRFIQVWEKLDGISGKLAAARSKLLTDDEKRELTQSFVNFTRMLLNGKQSDVKMEEYNGLVM
ncbi:ANK_REP_REGION domain-containing protein [Trichoderma simmonsii]|uniref:ANK_REP_REGION domain-containing protein n=1 Tax=Trichoderma simmonsii TaxID=1491479 RepID=A0A8G0PED8_9HYPO|nr:ANK_REP_REGION domain-containing protein [Trichoderma simmonsii]